MSKIPSALRGSHVASGFVDMLARYLQSRQLQSSELQYAIEQWRGKQRLPFTQWWKMLEMTQALRPEAALGLAIGRHFRASDAGVLGYLAASVSTVGEALTGFERFQKLVYDANPGRIELSAEGLSLQWGTERGLANQLVDETAITTLICFLREVTGQPELAPLKVEFVNPAPANCEPYTAFFRCPVLFERPITNVQFPLAILQLPIHSQDRALQQLLDQQARQMLQTLPAADALIEQMIGVICQLLAQGEPRFAGVAAALHTSERTLHRRLAEHGLQFQTLLRNIRQQLARQYLADSQLSLSDIALLLGYAEHSAFTRAFRSWFAISPLQYRQQQIRQPQ